MADAYDEMERLMKEYEALAQSDLPAALEKMIDLYFDETYENTFNYDVYDGIEFMDAGKCGRQAAGICPEIQRRAGVCQAGGDNPHRYERLAFCVKDSLGTCF